MGKIMLLEDDQSLIDGLVYSLKKEKFEVQVVSTVADAKNCIEQQEQSDDRMRGKDGTVTEGRIDLMLLDVTLPDGTGFEVCEYARAKGSAVPIMFLTVADEEYNVIRGLDFGMLTQKFIVSLLIPCALKRTKLWKNERKDSRAIYFDGGKINGYRRTV